MNTTKCADCPQAQLTLWTTVDNPVDNRQKSVGGFPPHAPPFQSQNLSFLCELFDALANAVDVLAAQVDRLQAEFDLHQEQSLQNLTAWTDKPLSPQALVEKLRALRDEIAL